MNDPTYDKDRIDADPVWELAFAMSEMDNDSAPIGWGKYVNLATLIMHNYDVKRK